MNIKVLKDIKDVLSIQGEMYIYGAKTIAQRLQLYLHSYNKDIHGFLVSEKYSNPETINGITVYRIEKFKNSNIDNVILAVSNTRAFWDVKKSLEKLNVLNFYVLKPETLDVFSWREIKTEKCSIDYDCIISDSAQIFADETSSVTIGSHVIIGDNVNIFATDHSEIFINDEVTIAARTRITCEHASKISIGSCCDVGCDTQITSQEYSEINIGVSCDIVGGCIIGSENSYIDFGNEIVSGVSSFITEGHAGIQVGDKSTFGEENWFGAVNDKITIGTDCMFSSHIQMIIGGHAIYDINSGENITHRNGVVIGNHVWIGLKTTIIDGVNIGDGSVVGAGSTVTKMIPSNVTCAGNPVRILHEDIKWERN